MLAPGRAIFALPCNLTLPLPFSSLDPPVLMHNVLCSRSSAAGPPAAPDKSSEQRIEVEELAENYFDFGRSRQATAGALGWVLAPPAEGGQHGDGQGQADTLFSLKDLGQALTAQAPHCFLVAAFDLPSRKTRKRTRGRNTL
jgi:hypothetical protein